MISTESAIEKMTLSVTQEIHVQASLEVTFATLLEQLGPFSETMEGNSMNMKSRRARRKVVPRPSDGNGHFWACASDQTADAAGITGHYLCLIPSSRMCSID